MRVRRLSELAAGGEPAGRLIGIVQGELVDAAPGAELSRSSRCRSAATCPSSPTRVCASPATGRRTQPATGTVALPVYGAGRPVGRFVLELEQGATGIQLPAEDRAARGRAGRPARHRARQRGPLNQETGMADIVFVVVVIIGFFALCAAFVVGCDRIVRSGDDGSSVASSEVTS